MANPRHKPTDAQIATVRAMAAYGIPQDDIAKVIGISPKTLRRHYGEQLEKGSIEATAKVAEFLFKQATTTSVAAAMFWMKCRAGWSERVQVDHSGSVSGAVIVSLPSNGREIDAGSNS
jgi:DNA-binding XRE family transcriptional regulator